ncbi:hypothetical protein PSPO01_08397 [Paraphaeosphaeria sporulosa]
MQKTRQSRLHGLDGDYGIDDVRGYPRPKPQPPASYPLPHPDHSAKQQAQKRLESYNTRNHGKFHERNRGSKKAGFWGMLKLLFKCGSLANHAAGAA